MATSNDQIIKMLNDQVLPEIREIKAEVEGVKTHLSVLNGAVARNVVILSDHGVCITDLQEYRTQSSELFAEIRTMLSEREMRYTERNQRHAEDIEKEEAERKADRLESRSEREIDRAESRAERAADRLEKRAEMVEVKASMKDIAEKVWENSYKLAGIVAAVGLLTKLAGLW